MPIYDLTAPITPDTPVFQGDPSFQFDKLHSVEHEDTYSLCHLHMSNHMGTHIDFPAHVIRGGKTSTHYPLEALIGPGIIIEWEASASGKITQEFVQQQKEKIVEGLKLKDVPPGEGEVIIAPLNIPDMDGLPARVIMRRQESS